MATLLIVDGHAYAYRAFYAIRQLRSASGAEVNAIYGFIRMFEKLRAALTPESVAVVWDGGLSGERVRDLPLYKANRPPMPDSLADQIEEIKSYLAASGVMSLCDPGVEADDAICSLAVRAAGLDRRVVIASSDKDFMQLVSERVSLVNPGDKQPVGWDAGRVVEKTGVTPSQIVDWLSLIGDSVDNIPGVPGVGPKTAADLLRRFGTLEGIDSGLDGIQSEKLRKSLVENREAVFRNRKLIALKSDLPVPGLEQIDGAVPDRERLRALFAGWGFRSLLAELGPEPAGQGRLL